MSKVIQIITSVESGRLICLYDNGNVYVRYINDIGEYEWNKVELPKQEQELPDEGD
jgi:hypothetical protein